MERREFLKVSTAATAGAAAVASSACTTGGAHLLAPPVVSLEDMDAFLERLDIGMSSISKANALASLVPAGADLEALEARVGREELARGDSLFRGTLRSLLLTGSFRDLPEEGRVHPGMQARLWESLDEMNDSMLGLHKYLQGLSPTERADLQRAIRRDPGLPMRVFEALDREAQATGVSLTRRLHMRQIAADVSFRMRHSTPLLVDEYTSKVERVVARSGADTELERSLVVTMGEAAFWEYHARTFAYAERWSARGATAGARFAQASGLQPAYGQPQAYPQQGPYPQPYPQPGSYPQPGPYPPMAPYYGAPPPASAGQRPIAREPGHDGSGRLIAGAVVLGLGVLTGGAGVAMVAAGEAGVATVGAILGGVGLAALIVGIVLMATS